VTPPNARPDPAASVAPPEILAGAGELGLQLTGAQAERLSRFAQLLLRWSAIHNLTAITSPDEVLSVHLLDSLSILLPTEAICGDRCPSLLDVGSGGGLPGIPLAIARPSWRVTAADKVQKKVAFLTQVLVELQLSNFTAVHARVEDLPRSEFDIIVARAFASLPDFIRVTANLLAPGGTWVAMKGVRPDGELAELVNAFPDVRVVDIVKLNVPRLGAERHLILLQRP